MKFILILVLLLIATKTYSQTDSNGNPVFNSITTNEEVIKDFRLVSNYYTLKTNIENRLSSVYISPKPSLSEISNAAINLPSDFFLIVRSESIVNMVMLINQPTRKFLVINLASGQKREFDCTLKGDVTENRANEVIKEQYDPSAKIVNKDLFFNDKKLQIISNQEIRTNVIDLIEKQKLSAGESSKIKLLSKGELKKMILGETKAGGKLDFFTAIKGHEMEGIQIKPGLFDTKIGIALYKWGRANFELGTNTVEDALEFWAEFIERQPNRREKDYIMMGFKKELEK